jgi:hypothetical protein
MILYKPKEIRLNDIIGKETIQKIDDFDRQVREYYLGLNNQSLPVFDQFMQLYFQLMVAIAEELPGFVPKFKRGSPVQYVLATSACGALRNLRVAHKLLLDGYFVEMHATLRMVEQWLECAVVVEGNPSAASQILEKGISSDDLRKALNSSKELETLHSNMRKTFSKLSQRAHPTKTAFDLIRKKEAKEQLLIGGIVEEEMFRKDAFALATLAVNSLNILSRHFYTLPFDWHKKFKEAQENLVK